VIEAIGLCAACAERKAIDSLMRDLRVSYGWRDGNVAALPSDLRRSGCTLFQVLLYLKRDSFLRRRFTKNHPLLSPMHAKTWAEVHARR
jgi:hypothetical protein